MDKYPVVCGSSQSKQAGPIVRQNSLSLFDELPCAEATASVASAAPPRRDAQQQHLRAARRLARQMRRFADQSAEQVHAGQQICRHLVAMLEEADAPTVRHSRH